MSILSTVLKAKFKKQPIMVVTFDPTYGFPEAKTRHCTEEQFSDAALFLVGKSREYGRISIADTSQVSKKLISKKRKKKNTVRKFFRILFTREKTAEFPIPRQLS